MSFLVRSVERHDLNTLFDLARQFTLLNLPADRRVIEKMIEKSIASFAGKITAEDAIYLFVVEDFESQRIVASSLIHGRCGTVESPNYSYQITKRDLFSRDLGIGFIHQVLRLKADSQGPTEIGGLLVDKGYRRRPEKLGKQISLCRFNYIALQAERFTNEIHVELAPPLTDEGRSEFWEALGRRFTGLPYQEADALSQQNKEFIKSLFPPEDIYLCLLDAKARVVLGRVGEETRPAQHMIEKMGFEYIDEVDPFDGGPHYRASREQLKPFTHGTLGVVTQIKKDKYPQTGMLGVIRDGKYFGGLVSCCIDGDQIALPEVPQTKLELTEGETAHFCPMSY